MSYQVQRETDDGKAWETIPHTQYATVEGAISQARVLQGAGGWPAISFRVVTDEGEHVMYFRPAP